MALPQGECPPVPSWLHREPSKSAPHAHLQEGLVRKATVSCRPPESLSAHIRAECHTLGGKSRARAGVECPDGLWPPEAGAATVPSHSHPTSLGDLNSISKLKSLSKHF